MTELIVPLEQPTEVSPPEEQPRAVEEPAEVEPTGPTEIAEAAEIVEPTGPTEIAEAAEIVEPTGPTEIAEAAEVAEVGEGAGATAVAEAHEPVSDAQVAPLDVPQPAPSVEPAAAGHVPAVDAPSLVPLEDIAPAIVSASLSRRAFLGFGLMVAGGLAGAAGLARLFPVFADDAGAASPIVPSYDPAGKAWTFVVDTASCIGCGLCVVACKEENHVAEGGEYNRTWVERHVRTTDGELYVDSPEAGIYGFPAESTAPGAAGKAVEASFFEPRLCMQCEDSPCTSVCPVGATYRTEDGVILVDARRCIGCGYCVVACPYGARYLTPAGGDNPNDMPGVADKCTWCYHRISRGAKPACVEVCPVGARQFGDASDPNSEIATLVRERKPQMLHPEYGTRPRVVYLGPAIEEA